MIIEKYNVGKKESTSSSAVSGSAVTSASSESSGKLSETHLIFG